MMQSYNAAWKNYENELANYHANYERKLEIYQRNVEIYNASCAAMQAKYERDADNYERDQASMANLEEQVDEAHGRIRTLSEAISNPAKSMCFRESRVLA